MGIRWTAWGTTVRVDVTDRAAERSAHLLVGQCVAEAERAVSLSGRRSDLQRLVRARGRATRIGQPLSSLIAVALDVADRSGGTVDPTVGAATVPLRHALRQVGDDRFLPTCTRLPYIEQRPAPGWACVTWSEDRVTVPAGVTLDLTATAKARTARLAASVVASRLGVGAMVEIGGDVATAGPAPDGGWLVAPEHCGGSVIELQPGSALAACRSTGIVDPLTGRMVSSPWRSVVVEGGDVVTAKAAAVTAVVHGSYPEERLRAEGLRALFLPWATDRAAGRTADRSVAETLTRGASQQ